MRYTKGGITYPYRFSPYIESRYANLEYIFFMNSCGETSNFLIEVLERVLQLETLDNLQ